MKVGVGYCNNRDAYYSGRSAAGDAICNGDLQSKDFAIAFCAGQLDHAEFLRGMQEIIGDTPIIGGSSVGVITNNNLSYTCFPSAVAIFQFDTIKYQVAAVGGLCDDEKVVQDSALWWFSTPLRNTAAEYQCKAQMMVHVFRSICL